MQVMRAGTLTTNQCKDFPILQLNETKAQTASPPVKSNPVLMQKLAQAREVITTVRSWLTHGTNTEKDCKNIDTCIDLITLLRKQKADFKSNYEQFHHKKPDFETVADFCRTKVKELGFAQCDELSLAGILELKDKGIFPLTFCITSIGRHKLIVVGIKDGANSIDMSTWGDAAVVDIWAEKTYPVSQFSEMQKPEYDVKYPRICYELKSELGQAAPPPYLAGVLQVLEHYNGSEWINMKD